MDVVVDASWTVPINYPGGTSSSLILRPLKTQLNLMGLRPA
jgi:hypothetical protein